MSKLFHLSCRLCGAAFETYSATALYCPSCRQEKRRECKRRGLRGQTVKQGTPRDVTCAQCGNVFTAYGGAAQYCFACKKLRMRKHYSDYAKTEKGKACIKRWKDKNPEKVREIDRKYREHRRRLREPLEALKNAVRQNLPGARLALAKAEGEMTYCERMHLTAYPLPCGTRGECQGCPHCPEDAPCNSRNFFVQQMVELGG